MRAAAAGRPCWREVRTAMRDGQGSCSRCAAAASAAGLPSSGKSGGSGEMQLGEKSVGGGGGAVSARHQKPADEEIDMTYK